MGVEVGVEVGVDVGVWVGVDVGVGVAMIQFTLLPRSAEFVGEIAAGAALILS